MMTGLVAGCVAAMTGCVVGRIGRVAGPVVGLPVEARVVGPTYGRSTGCDNGRVEDCVVGCVAGRSFFVR